jgi:carbonic anhydrase
MIHFLGLVYTMPSHSHLKGILTLFNSYTKPFLSPENPTMSVQLEMKNREWQVHFPYYLRLLSSNTFYHNRNNPLLQKGFAYPDLKEYIFMETTVDTIPLNLDQTLYSSLVRRPKLIWLPCMDERIQYLTSSHHALSLGMPGCECLLQDNEREIMAQILVQVCKSNPTITEIIASSHSSCGAVSRAFSMQKNSQRLLDRVSQMVQKEDKILDQQGVKYANRFAEIITKNLYISGMSNVHVRTHHFAKNELHSQDFHNAFGAVVNFDPLLNTADFEDSIDIPLFNIFAGGQSSKQILTNLELSTLIAGGVNGFGNDFFTRRTPFVFLFTANLATDEHANQIIRDVIVDLKDTVFPIDVVYKVLDTSS